MLDIVSREDSKFFKEQNPYFHTNGKHGRDADTLVVFVLTTPTGKFSKYWATIKFNADNNVKDKMKKVEEEYTRLQERDFKEELKKGYRIGEVILYSGNLDD